jgi:hypothetical protein
MIDERDAWDNQRLAAAFAAYAAVAPDPNGVVAATTNALRRQGSTPRPWWHRPVPALLAGALAVAGVVLSVQLLSGMTTSEPASSADPSSQPTRTLGLPIIDVPTAIARRDADEDDTALAVRGWVSPVGLASCPSPLGLEILLQTSCPEPIRLTADPESAVTVTRNGVGTVTFQDTPPTGASVDLVLDQVDTSWIPPLPDSGPAGVADVVLLGHFDDDRAAYCPAEEAQACRDRFVVDRVVWADGREVTDEPDVAPATTVSAPTDVVATVDGATDGDAILGITPVFGPDIRRMDPAVVAHPEIGTRDVYWSVRVLEDGRSVRYVVVDGSTGVYRVHGMDVQHIAGTPPDDLPVSDVDDSATVRPIGDVRGGWEATFGTNTDLVRKVTIVDRTGTLLDVRPPTDEEAQQLPIDGPTLLAARLGATSTIVGWGGSLCETETGLEITRGQPPMLTLRGRSDAVCRSALTTTRLVLDWSGERDDVGLTDARGAHAFPTAVAALVVLPVGEAIAIRDTDDRRELAVKGWIRWEARTDCGASEDRPLLDPGCQDAAARGHLVGADGVETIRFVVPTSLELPSEDGAPVVLVGHFDDRRATQCGNRVDVCQDAFVVDATWVHGSLTSGAWQRPVDADPPRATRDLVNRTMRDIVQGLDPRLLAVGAIRGAELEEIEPAVDGSSLATERWVWHLTMLLGDRVRTILITDHDLLERAAGRSYEWFEVVGSEVVGTGADIN